MSYVNDNLRRGEKIIMEGKVSYIAFIPALVGSLVICLILSLILKAFDIGYVAWIIFVISVIVNIVKLVNNELAVTSKTVTGKTGVFKVKAMNSPFERIDSVSVNESLFGRIFKYGTVIVCTPSCIYNFNYLSNARNMRDAILTTIDDAAENKSIVQGQIIGEAIKSALSHK